MLNDSDMAGTDTFFNGTGSLRMISGSYYIPKMVNLSNPLGEDAHFAYPDAQTIGVADGAGGWVAKGVDSRDYSHELMINVVRSIRENGTPVDPREVLEDAILRTEKGIGSSSTACIITVCDDYLHAVNVGDSGFLHFRGGEIIYKSPVQQYYNGFNSHPVQLSDVSSSADLRIAMEIKRAIAPGDIIVAGTDGLFDNLHLEEIQQLLNQDTTCSLHVEQMARKIANFAFHKSVDGTAYTPFAVERRKAGKVNFLGGKNDDITVVVACIIPANFEGFYLTEDYMQPGIITWMAQFCGIPTSEDARIQLLGTQD